MEENSVLSDLILQTAEKKSSSSSVLKMLLGGSSKKSKVGLLAFTPPLLFSLVLCRSLLSHTLSIPPTHSLSSSPNLAIFLFST